MYQLKYWNYTFSDASVSVKDIIKQADTAMYVAKNKVKMQ